MGAAEGADAGPATANAEGGQRKRKAEGPDTTEGGAVAPLKAEAESGVPPPRAKKARKRKKPSIFKRKVAKRREEARSAQEQELGSNQ